MNTENRLQQLSAVPTIPRQTPKQDFGTELTSALGQAAQTGASILRGSIVSAPLISAAVAAVGQVATTSMAPVTTRQPFISAAPSRTTTSSLGTGTTSIPTSATASPPSLPEAVPDLVNGSSMELLQKQQQMQTESQSFSSMYLNLQDQMQQENRQYNAISNIIKSRHDSAKSAINNIR